MRFFKICSFVIVASLLVACSTDSAKEQTDSTQQEKVMNYTVVVDEKLANTAQHQIRITTEATDKKDFEQITKAVMDTYENQQLDSMHLYIHTPGEKEFGELKAHSFIAYTQKGAAQTGLDKKDSYKIEYKEVIKEVATPQANEPSEQQWQDAYKQVVISEAKRYIELKERDGQLEMDRLQSYSNVIASQANKTLDPTNKSTFDKLAAAVLADPLDEVQALLATIN